MAEKPVGPGTQRGVGPGSFGPDGSRSDFRGIGAPVGSPGLLQSFEGVVTSSQMVAQESQKATKEIIAATDRTARMMGTIIERAGQMMGYGGGHAMPMWQAWARSGAIGLTVGPENYGATGMLPGYGVPVINTPGAAPPPVAPPPSGHQAPPPPSSAPPPSLPRRGVTRGGGMTMPDDRGFDEGGVPETAVPWGGPSSWQEGRNYSLGDLRQGVARGVNRRVSEWGWQYDRAQDDAGRWRNGRGQFAEAPDWKTKGVQIARNTLGEMAEGKGLGEAVASAAPAVGKALGVAGAVYTGVRMAEQFAVDQRSANMEYQSILGGTNAEGFKERLGNFGFRMSQFGTMGAGDAHTIYMGAIENYGTDQGLRNRYQNAATDLYRNSGLSADESTRLLNMAAGAGNDNLTEFADAIREVGKAAREAGESAADGRAYFQEAFQGTQGYATGSAQIGAARGMASVRIGLGDRFSDASFAGMDSPINLRRMAQSQGMSYPDFIAATTGGQPGGSMLIARGRQSLVRQSVAGIDPQGTMFRDAQAQFDAVKTKNGTVTREQMDRIGAEIMAKYDVDPTILAANMRMNGIEVTDADAMSMFMQMGFGGVNFEEQEADRISAITQTVEAGDRNVVGRGGKRYNIGSGGSRGITPGVRGMGTSKNELGDTKAGVQFNKDMTKFLRDQFLMDEGSQKYEFEHGFNEGSGKGPFAKDRDRRTRLRNSLLNSAMDTGRYNSVGGAIWQDWDQFGDDARFVVKVPGKNGTEERAVDAYELAEYYGDQMQNRPEDIRIIGGKNAGKTVGQVLGVEQGDKSVKITSSTKGPAKGEKVSEAEKDAEKKADKSSGKVEIVPDPWLRQFFQFRTSGSAYDAYLNGMPPESSATSPSSDRYTTGTNSGGN